MTAARVPLSLTTSAMQTRSPFLTSAFVALWVVLMAATSWAQETDGKVIGKVIDAVTGKAVPGASLVLAGAGGSGGAAAVTNSRGVFTIVGLPAGDYRMKVSRDGYTPITGQKIRINANYTTRMDVSLPNPTALAEQKKLDDKKKQDDLLRAQQLAATRQVETSTPGGGVAKTDLPEPAAPIALATLDPAPVPGGEVVATTQTDLAAEIEGTEATIYEDIPSEAAQLIPESMIVAYPDIARRSKVKGIVFVQVTVESDGSVSGGKVVKGITGLDEAALDAVVAARFTPAMQGDKPVASRLMVPIRFDLAR